VQKNYKHIKIAKKNGVLIIIHFYNYLFLLKPKHKQAKQIQISRRKCEQLYYKRKAVEKKKNKQKTTITLGFSRWQMKSKSQIERSKCKKPTTKFSKLRTHFGPSKRKRVACTKKNRLKTSHKKWKNNNRVRNMCVYI